MTTSNSIRVNALWGLPVLKEVKLLTRGVIFCLLLTLSSIQPVAASPFSGMLCQIGLPEKNVKARCTFTLDVNPRKSRFSLPGSLIQNRGSFMDLRLIHQPVKHAPVGYINGNDNLVRAGCAGDIDPVAAKSHRDAIRLRLQLPTLMVLRP